MIAIQDGVPLAPLTTMGVGGPARHFTRVESEQELRAALAWARERELAPFLLGGGSNLVVSDAGLPTLVVRTALRGVRSEERGHETRVTFSAGEPWDDAVRFTVERGLWGLECLSGIPGDVGATPIQNVGAYGCEVADSLVEVVAIDRSTGERVSLNREACGFAYRDSVFKRSLRDRLVIVEVTFALSRGRSMEYRYAELSRALATRNQDDARQVRETVLELRRNKSMLFEPERENGRSVGSFFTNPIVTSEHADEVEARARSSGALAAGETMPRFPAASDRVKLAAGWLIERSGLNKGTRDGCVGLSSKHALAIVNLGGATAREVIAFATRVQAHVETVFGVTLHTEPELVGFEPSQLGSLRAT